MKSDSVNRPDNDSQNKVLQEALKELFPDGSVQKPSDSMLFRSK